MILASSGGDRLPYVEEARSYEYRVTVLLSEGANQ